MCSCWTSVGQFVAGFTKQIRNLNKWLQSNREIFHKAVNTQSPEYKKAVKEYRHRLEVSMNRVSDYLDKKNRDFERNGNRRDDPDNQKWEQRRIRTALHSFDTLKMLQGNKKQSEAQAQRNEKLEGYKDTLLSLPSRAIFDADNNPKKTAQGGISL